MTTEPSLTVLRALQSIHATGSVSQTAGVLGVTQSAISRSIGKYEKAIGLQMLHRDARPLTLTEEGLLVVAHAAEIDRSIQTLSDRLKALRQGKEGVVRIGSFGSSATSRLLPALLSKFARLYPGISVSILEGPTKELVRTLSWVTSMLRCWATRLKTSKQSPLRRTNLSR